MQKNGWTWSGNDFRVNDPFYLSHCSRYGKSWYGYAYGNAIGTIAATFQGSGSAVLSYGNCYGDGDVIVSLNGNEISRIWGLLFEKEISFGFAKGDILEVKEHLGIIKLNAFKINQY